MKTKILTGLVAGSFLLSFSPRLVADNPAPAQPTAESTADAAADGKFISDAEQGNLAEIKLSKLAESRTKRSDVKGYAQMIVSDHQNIKKQLEDITDKMNIKLPTDPSDAQKATYDQLKKAADADFDRMYVSTMVTDHEAVVKMYEDTSARTKHPAVKAFVDRNLPALRTHLQKAQEIAKTVGAVAAK